MTKEGALGTVQKALDINLDPTKYGTIAEIGAGQEVARHFFRAGGASGTIAKTMSAYDMKFSDAIYGEEEHGRYVSRSRLEKMLKKEYNLLITRVSDTRPEATTFFAFANTVSTQGYGPKREAHGWVGIKLQLYPKSEPSEVILHVRLLDETGKQQQQALGVFGVNLVYAAFHHYKDPKKLIESLTDGLGNKKIEVDMIHLGGFCFDEIDDRLLSLHLVRQGMTNAVIFNPDKTVAQASDILYKKEVLILRGNFKPFTNLNSHMLQSSCNQFFGCEKVDDKKHLVMAEITMNTIVSGGEVNPKDFLARVDMLCELGYTVLISNYFRYFRLRSYINRYTKKKLAMVMGAPSIFDIFNEQYYDGMEGGILEAFGKLFTEKTYLYVYPMLDKEDRIIKTKDIMLPKEVDFLYKFLIENKKIIDIENFDKELLTINSNSIRKKIRDGDLTWKDDVPEEIAAEIAAKRLFGYTEN